ncbi:MAG: Ig-like domain repeat protein, partial [Propionibacteriaceae bacterium]|nr:Ig-like domain repeat protein [Propionibacteriaceae bacterium]
GGQGVGGDGTFTIRISDTSDYYRICVENYGPGEFSPVFTLENTAANCHVLSPGTHTGLALRYGNWVPDDPATELEVPGNQDGGGGTQTEQPRSAEQDSPSDTADGSQSATTDPPKSTQTPQAVPAAVAAYKPSPTGSAKVGGTLSAAAIPAGWSAKYQWTRDGAAISGATSAKYKLTAKDAGHKVALTVTLSKAGYETAVKTSTATKVPQLTPTVSAKLAKATVKAKNRAVVKVSVKASGLKPAGKVKVSYGKKSVTATVKNGKASVKLPKLKKGKYTVKVTYLGTAELKKQAAKKALKLKVK